MAPKKKKDKWRKAFDKRDRNLEDSKAPGEPSDVKETPSLGTEGSQGACGSSADEKPGGKRQGRFAKKQMEAKMHGRYQGRKEAGPDHGRTPGSTGAGSEIPKTKGAGETSGDKQPSTRNGQGDNFNKPDQTRKTRGRGVSTSRWNSQGPSLNGRGKPLDNKNQDQRPGKPNPIQQNKRPLSHGVFPGTSNSLDLKTLKEKNGAEIVQKLNEGIVQLRFLLRSQEEHHNSDEFIFDLTCMLAIVCKGPSGENANKILAALKGSAFLSMKIPRLLNRIQASLALKDHDSRQTLFQCLIVVFTRYLTHLPSSYVDLPYVQVKRALEQSDIDRKEELQKELDAFKQMRDEIIRAERQKYGGRYRAGQKPPNDFRDIPICPTNKEITTQEKPFLRESISKGRYENAEHYLDVQFRLLREDFLEPLREGIKEIVQNVPKQQRKQLLKNYRRVRIFNKELTWSGIIHHVKIDVSGLDTSRWAHSKRLMFGSFLCLSNDNFNTMLFATVSNRDPEELKRGRIDIRFIEEQDVLGIENRNCVYQMVESPAYFEAYRHVLKGLKELDEGTLPFQKYIVECSGDVDPPEYLRGDDTKEGPICYDLSKALDVKNTMYTAVPVLLLDAWPSVEEVPLNNSQLEALRTAITTEFSVIQGPPGTGKTYVGAKIVKCLLENRAAWDPQRNSPMLMVCYTNHALDQFLEKVLEFLPKEEIIRVGGRCKSERLEGCNLKKFTYQFKLYQERHNVREKMINNDKDLKQCKKHLAEADKQLLELRDLEPLMHSEHTDQLYRTIFPYNATNKSRTPANIFRLWLCDNKEVNRCNQNTITETEDETESQPDGMVFSKMPAFSTKADSIVQNVEPKTEDEHTKIGDEVIDVCEETIVVEREVDLIQHQRYIEGDEDLLMPVSEQTNDFTSQAQDHAWRNEETGEGFTKVSYRKKGKANQKAWFETEGNNSRQNKQTKTEPSEGNKNKNKALKDLIIKDIQSLRKDLKKETMMSIDEAMGVTNIWSLTQSSRFRLYLFWVENYRDRYRFEIYRSEQEYEQLCQELQTVKFQEDEQVIRQATVVGMTTSGAARYHSVLQRVTPRIVVIEEAAEVMEAHIITSLSHNTKHTILIGDHKQLRPKATVYELAQKYNLEVSLFERMVRNKMKCQRLSIQHRMRPEIASLTKRIYDHEIIDHESVCHFEDISGVCHNVFFINHCQREESVDSMQSFSNPHEATLVIALCKYLELQGYERNNITILTMYTGQLLLLQRQMPRENFEGVRVCVVDNFQGEENDIILLSLVRSNWEGRIGFLAESNRICVALSRARKGLYCIGNFNLLKSQSKLWEDICDDLKQKGAIAETLQLVCKRHANVTNVKKASDFNPLGGCSMPCETRLPCGHACDKPCHVSSHVQNECRKACPNRCANNHPCPRKCHFPRKCSICLRTMSKKVPKCGHEQQIPCSVDPKKFSCRIKCEKMLPCKHICSNKCGQVCTSQCKVSCIKSLRCGHQTTLPCYKDPMDYVHCDKKCTKILECGHSCSMKCKEKCRCDAKIDVQLRCEHKKRVLCHEKGNPIQCNDKCKRQLSCGHDCPGMCYEECKLKQCHIVVVKDLPCGHQERVPCYQDPQTAFCYAPCPRQLDCGHRCSSVCGRLCYEVQCEELCQRKCERGHSCQRRCHFGSVCGNCMVEVFMIIPRCGHSIKVPCYIDPATQKCKQPCQTQRVCGHPCGEICSKNCESKPCKVHVTTTLPCNHVVSLECHRNPQKFICKKEVEVNLSCGHKTSLKCHVAKAGLESVLCKTPVEKELGCYHKITLPCFKNPKDCVCRRKVNVELACGHMKSLHCSTVTAGVTDILCTVKVRRTLPCNHEAILPCYRRPEEHCCDEEVESTLSCGHIKRIACSSVRDRLRGGTYAANVTRELSYGHEKEIQCSDDPEKVYCDALCQRFLPCGHPCPKKCGDNCDDFKCIVRIKKELSCGYHKVSCLCSEDVSQVICSNPCERYLTCGHKCSGKCYEDCTQHKCLRIVVKNLQCEGNHSLKMPCSSDPLRVACPAPCNRKLECGHPCTGLCTQPCNSITCIRGVEKKYPCGHKEHLQCFQSKTATCKAPCRRRERCKHMCKGICGEPCSNYPCDVVLGRTLSCGHKVQMPCSSSVDDVQCPAPCGATLPCDHKCSGTCNDCKQRGSHEMCQQPCSRLLVCLHRCKAICSEPCPPCDRKCTRLCPHAKCSKKCSQLCAPCTKSCTWSCPHYQCNNLCGEACQRPPCNAPCPKKLACHHPCIGLCGENCPTLCAICHAKKLSSILAERGRKVSEAKRYLQLFDCGHILAVEEMDAWMVGKLISNAQLIRCPRCSTAITFSYRYEKLVKVTLSNIDSVKKQVEEIAKESFKLASSLLRESNRLFIDLRLMKFPRNFTSIARIPYITALDSVGARNIPLVSTLKNHLIVLRQVEKVEGNLPTFEKHQANYEDQREIKKQSDSIKEASEKIRDYLMEPQLDLRTLHQVHEDTRKLALLASVLEAQSEAINRQKPFSSTTQTHLKLARKGFKMFLEGNNDALKVHWLEEIVASMRKEVGLPPLPKEEPEEFENFPALSKDEWKLCEHRQVYYTRRIVRDGEDITITKSSCTQCDEGQCK